MNEAAQIQQQIRHALHKLNQGAHAATEDEGVRHLREAFDTLVQASGASSPDAPRSLLEAMATDSEGQARNAGRPLSESLGIDRDDLAEHGRLAVKHGVRGYGG